MTRHAGIVWHMLAAVLIAGGMVAGTGTYGAAAAPATHVRTAAASPVIGTIALGSSPVAVAVDAATDRVFVPDTDLQTGCAALGVLEARTGALLRTVALQPLGSCIFAAQVGVDTRTARVFVSSNDANGQGYMTTLDARSGAALHTIQLGSRSSALAVDEATARVFVANTASGTISVLDSRSGRVVTTTRVKGHPDWLVAAPGVGRIYVDSSNPWQVSILDARTGAVVAAPKGALAVLDVDGRAGRALAEGRNGALSVLDARSGAVLSTGRTGVSIVYSNTYSENVDTRLGRAYVAGPPLGKDDAYTPAGSRLTGSLLAIDTRTGSLAQHIAVTPHPTLIAVDAARGRVLTATIGPLNTTDDPGDALGPGWLEVRDARTLALLRTVQLGVVPRALALAPGLDRAYVVDAAISLSPVNFGREPIVGGQVLTHGSVTVLDLARL